MAGVLVLAAGVHSAMDEFDFLAATWGYASVVQVLWLARIYLLDESAKLVAIIIVLETDAVGRGLIAEPVRTI